MAWILPATAWSVSRARHAVIDLLRANSWDEEGIDEAALMTTEIATNAVLHARTPYTLTIDVSIQRLRVDVRDASTLPPRVIPLASASALGGRGLALVSALADQWGYQSTIDGKSVWFETTSRPQNRST
jgi:anti-sigma regulatory factor (Ser/Thr protein kinase)